MKNSQKGFIVPVLIAIIALLVIGGGVYVYKNKKVEIPAVVGTQQTNTQTPPVNTPTNNPPAQTDTSSSSTNTSVKISNVLPSGSIFTQGEGASIPLSWSVASAPAGATIYLNLLSSDGSESLGRITNNPDCSKGGDTIALTSSIKSYKWDGLWVCSNWQAHSVNPGSYKMGVSLYSTNGTTIIATGQSNTPFSLQK